MKGYKGMNQDMTCRGKKYEVGKIYHIGGEIELCTRGIHFCESLKNVFNFYPKEIGRFFEVETTADANVISDGMKTVTSKLKIIRELEEAEVNRAVYGYGNGNGNGNGDGNGYGYGYCYGYGNGYGYGYGNGNGYGDGNGNGYGYGNGNGYGDGYGNGNGNGNGYGYSYGYGDGIQKILVYI